MKFPNFLKLLFLSPIIVVMIVCVVTYAPIPKHWPFQSKAELERIRAELPLAEARWKAHGITSYAIEVNGVIHPNFCVHLVNHDFLPWHLKIKQGEIIFESDAQKRNVEEECHVSNFLPPKVFDTIRQTLEHAQPEYQYLTIEFDPEYGFLSYYSLTSNNTISDLNIGFTFRNFHPEKP